jgi:hypothetical protein
MAIHSMFSLYSDKEGALETEKAGVSVASPLDMKTISK